MEQVAKGRESSVKEDGCLVLERPGGLSAYIVRVPLLGNPGLATASPDDE